MVPGASVRHFGGDVVWRDAFGGRQRSDLELGVASLFCTLG